MIMKRNVLELWVGVFVALGVAALLFLSFKVASGTEQTGGSATYTVTASFNDIGGLKVKAPVKSAGVVVGRVGSIVLNPEDYRAKVTMHLQQPYQFSRDASAQILTSGILGEQYIGLMQGAEEATLANGDNIDLTSDALVLEQLIGKFMTSFAEKNAGE
ncbi:mammalian cell entry-related protein [Vitreoscilla sp. C1]|nr:mammalian cell entry-related protein [Vitreoscilla sp. C1]